MAGLFSHPRSLSPVKYTSMQVQTSAVGLPIPIVIGANRVSTNLIWYGNFQAQKHEEHAGKGGGGSSEVTYSYTAAVIQALCVGPIDHIGTIWKSGNEVTLSYLGYTIFNGSLPSTASGTEQQQPPGWMTSNFPDQALGYSGISFVFNSSLDLGSSASVPQVSWEVFGLNSQPVLNVKGGAFYDNFFNPDLPMSVILDMFLTPGKYPEVPVLLEGMSGSLGQNLSSDYFYVDGAWSTIPESSFDFYCRAQGLVFSPVLTGQEQFSQTLARWAQLSNSWIFWNGFEFRAVPLGTTSIPASAANGNTAYVPMLTPVFNFTESQLLMQGTAGAIVKNRSDPLSAYNMIQLNFNDRTLHYENNQVYWNDPASSVMFGKLLPQQVAATEVTQSSVAKTIAGLIGARSVYIRNTYTFKVASHFCFLEQGDIVSITSSKANMEQFPVRIRSLEEDVSGNITIIAEECPASFGLTAIYQGQAASQGQGPDYSVFPGPTNLPAIFQASNDFKGDSAEICIGVSGGANWGGCDVYVSVDNQNYSKLATITSKNVQGFLLGSMTAVTGYDSTNTILVDTTMCALPFPTGATSITAQAQTSLIIIDDEIMSYSTVTQGPLPNQVYLSGFYRGLFGTVPATHGGAGYFTLGPVPGDTSGTDTYPAGSSLVAYTGAYTFGSTGVQEVQTGSGSILSVGQFLTLGSATFPESGSQDISYTLPSTTAFYSDEMPHAAGRPGWRYLPTLAPGYDISILAPNAGQPLDVNMDGLPCVYDPNAYWGFPWGTFVAELNAVPDVTLSQVSQVASNGQTPILAYPSLVTVINPATINAYMPVPGWYGDSIYLKFLSFNMFNDMGQSLADVSPYMYNIQAAIANALIPPTDVQAAVTQVINPSTQVPSLSLNITWQPSASPTVQSYNVQQSSDGGNTWSSSENTGTTVTQASISDVLPNQAYLVRVQAQGTSANATSAWAELAQAVTTGTYVWPAPAAPTNLEVIAALEGANISFSATPTPQETFQVYYQALAEGQQPVFDQAQAGPTGATTTIAVVGLQGGQLYAFWVQASNPGNVIASPLGPVTATTLAQTVSQEVSYEGSTVAQITAGSGTSMAVSAQGDLTIGLAPQPAVMMFSYTGGLPQAGEEFFKQIIAGFNWNLPANLVGSIASCDSAPTNDVTLEILSQGQQIATVSFAAGVRSGKFAMPNAVQIASGSTVSLIAPTPQDATFSNPSITLVGTR